MVKGSSDRSGIPGDPHEAALSNCSGHKVEKESILTRGSDRAYDKCIPEFGSRRSKRGSSNGGLCSTGPGSRSSITVRSSPRVGFTGRSAGISL